MLVDDTRLAQAVAALSPAVGDAQRFLAAGTAHRIRFSTVGERGAAISLDADPATHSMHRETAHLAFAARHQAALETVADIIAASATSRARIWLRTDVWPKHGGAAVLTEITVCDWLLGPYLKEHRELRQTLWETGWTGDPAHYAAAIAKAIAAIAPPCSGDCRPTSPTKAWHGTSRPSPSKSTAAWTSGPPDRARRSPHSGSSRPRPSPPFCEESRPRACISMRNYRFGALHTRCCALSLMGRSA